jgi:nitrogen fixation protein NifZ
MEQRFDFGVAVRLTRNVRNDGTFPGLDVGNLLIKRGSIGYVMNVGTFLQDQIIYTINFLDQGRIVGCRDEELISADDPWVESRFETREKVISRLALSIRGEVVVPAGSEGEIFKVLRDLPDGVQYHVHFPGGRMLQVAENLLDALPDALPDAALNTTPEQAHA